MSEEYEVHSPETWEDLPFEVYLVMAKIEFARRRRESEAGPQQQGSDTSEWRLS